MKYCIVFAFCNSHKSKVSFEKSYKELHQGHRGKVMCLSRRFSAYCKQAKSVVNAVYQLSKPMATVYCVIQPAYLYQIYCSQQLNKQLTSEKNIFECTIISFHRLCMLAIIQTDSETITAMAKDCNRILLFLQLFSLVMLGSFTSHL